MRRTIRNGTQRKDSTMRLCHFEDALVADLEPLSLTRPAFELLCGCTSLAEKQARYFSLARGPRPAARPDRGALVRPYLTASVAERWPQLRVNDLAWLRSGPVVLVNGRWLPPAPGLHAGDEADAPCLGIV